MPDAIIAKAPSADLWPGQTDESEAGFSYPELDRLLFWLVDKRRSPEELVAKGFAGRAGRPGSTGRSPAPSSSARSRRSPSSGRGRPASTTSTRAGGRARPAVTGRDRATRLVSEPGGTPVRRRDADRQPRRRHAPGDRDAPGGPAHRGRGHPDQPPAARPARDRRPGSSASTPGTPTRRLPELLEHLRGGADLALVTDAGTPGVSDPGEELVRAWAAEGGTRRADPGRVGRPGGGRRDRASPGRAGRSRGSCRGAAASGASGWPGSPPTSAAASIYEAPGRVAATLARPGRGLRAGAPGRGLPRADQAPRGDRPRDARRARAERAATARLTAPRRVRARRRRAAAGRGDRRRSTTSTAERLAGAPGRRSSGSSPRGRPAAMRPGRSRPRPGSRVGSSTAPAARAAEDVPDRPWPWCDAAPSRATTLGPCPPSTTRRRFTPTTAPRGAPGWRRTTRPSPAPGS